MGDASDSSENIRDEEMENNDEEESESSAEDAGDGDQQTDSDRADPIAVDSKRFAIPPNDDYLMSDTVYKFVVKSEITMEEARNAIAGFTRFLDDGDYFEIHTFFDEFYHISRSHGKIRTWDLWIDLVQLLLQGFNSFKPDLVNTVCHVASVGDDVSQNMKDTCADKLEFMEMFVYLIKNLVLRLETLVVKRAYIENGAYVSDEDELGYDDDAIVDENIPDDALEVWYNVRNEILEMIDFICCLNISRGNGEVIENAIQYLSRPPRLDGELLRCFSAIILKFASHPRYAKKTAKDELEKLFAHMRPICVGFDYASSFAEELVDASMKFDYLKDARSDYPFVDVLEKVAGHGRMHEQMLSVMLMRLWRLVPFEAAGTLQRPYVALVQKLSNRAPEVFLDHCAQAARALDYDPPALRTAILEAFCQNICNNELLAPKYVRPGTSVYNSYVIMTDCLLDFLADANPQVRLNVLGYWIQIANARRVPFDSLKKGLFFVITERLKTEKSAAARKLAMQFLVLYLLLGPFGKELNFAELSQACTNLAEFIKRIEVLDPERPGVQVIMNRFNSFSDQLKETLTRVIETKKYEENTDDLTDKPLEDIILVMVDMVEMSMEPVACILAKMCYLGKFKKVDPNVSTNELVDAIISEFRRYYITMHMGYIGDSLGQTRLEEMGVFFEENMDRAERAVNVVQEKMLFAEQMTLLFSHIYEALEQNSFTDVNYAVTFFATCYRFKIRKSASALYKMYLSGNTNAVTEVLNTIRMLFLKRNARGDVDIMETANSLMEKLTDQEDGDRVAIEELIYHAFVNDPFPPGLVTHLMNIVCKVYSPFKCPALAVLPLLTRIDPYGMRKHFRVFHKCIRCKDVREAFYALQTISLLIPTTEDDPVKEEENHAYRLRATDSLFADIENLFIRILLSDYEERLSDGTPVSDYWYRCTRSCIKAVFAIAADVDFVITRLLAKSIFFAKRATEAYIAHVQLEEAGKIPQNVSQELIKKRKGYLNGAWQRTTERALIIIAEIVEGILAYVDNNFPKLLKRSMELGDAAAQDLEDVTEPYADYARAHTDLEMDFAYQEGIFARTVAAKMKVADSQPAEKNGERSETESHLSESHAEKADKDDDDDEDDNSNRPSTDELIRTRTMDLLETKLLQKDHILGRCLTMVVYFVRCPNNPKPITDAALQAFSKFLLICPQFSERASSLFLTFTCCHPDADMREYLLVSAVDIMQRFPSMLDRQALFLFEMTVDVDASVKITALLYLTKMLTRDILKPRGTLSNVALCMLRKSAPSNNSSSSQVRTGNREVIALARKLFYEISIKGNLLVNVMPDIICRVCRFEKEVSLSDFRFIVKKLLPLIADKPLDSVVEKMCQRFEFCNSAEATAHNKHIAHYFSYFISQLPLSDSSFYKMRDSIAYFAPFLEDLVVYNDLIAPLNHLVSSTQSLDVKHDAEEFLLKVEFLHVRHSLTEEERDRMSRAVGPINLDVPVKLDKDVHEILSFNIMPGGRGNRRDVKQLSKNRFSRLDSDIVSSYVDDDEDERPRPRQGTVSRVINMLAGRVMHGNGGNRRGRKDEQTMRSAGGVSRHTEMVYKIRIPYGRKFTVPWIMKQLHQQIEDIKPLLVTVTPRGDVEFFLKSEDTADACKAISRRIVHKITGDRMSILVDKVVAPWTKLNKEETAVIQEVVDSRYNHDSRSLDLSEFALDQKFKDRDLHMMLNKNNVMLTVVDRIDERYGSITALSLQGNRLRFLDYAAVLVSVTKLLKVLDLSNNQIDKISELEKLKGLPVETLFFEGNPLVEQLTTASGYLSAVHQVFPKVCVLDGSPVQPAAVHVQSLDDDEITTEPPSRPGFYGSDNLRVLVERFLVEYYKLYDGEEGNVTRKNLVQAYDQDNSSFTITISHLKDMSNEGPVRYPNDACYNLYIRSSHNVLCEERWQRNRAIRTYRGAMDIAVALSKLPITNHYTESFIVDTHLISEELLAFTVQGLFEDGKFAKPGEVPQLSFFSRSFVVSPRANESIAVISDMLYITGITPARVARYKLMLNKAASNGPAPGPAAPVAPMNPIAQATNSINGLQMSSQPSIEVKKQMVEQFCKDSGMIPAWSEKCLIDFDWNYEAAGQAFVANKDSIPKEAFASV
ncbi:unnamed protein product [Cylicocyclus nassatus]|uniref:Uncharacterized protein n=1 Tax=Cylicocyclus nassatus TaxID=53992 RepID=A0AA36DPL7_CYLNA|nr:unnamed protein product [Cylicocyclus nassatus]